MFDDGQPIYVQIAEQIRNEILAGSLMAGERIMSTNEYAQFFRINPATAAKGINLLVDDGILYKRRGVGMFVNADAREVLLGRRRERFFRDQVDPVVAEAHLLEVPLDEVIDRIRNSANHTASTTTSQP